MIATDKEDENALRQRLHLYGFFYLCKISSKGEETQNALQQRLFYISLSHVTMQMK